ncbi:SusC/RagA family TonB-linked outer membrane protein [Neolewinella agarilytica]|nr:SusC/RagA family TonB-linked outer membrane protein [Neolewinella agarilytica]
MAQSTVSGTITDADNGDPLIGASILVTGTSTGTVTDFDGKYTVNVPANAESLTISYTGYATQTIALTGQSTLDIQLASGELLDEVVVVGYGTVTQKEVTSAVTTVEAKDFNVGDINDPTQLIQGKVAGLSISKAGGDVNGGTDIRLRGLSSFGGNTQPLIIIDGVTGADLRTVDPSDIESINVLKDGSAAAIYGIQASAGVIIVTTKRGTEGGGQVDYRGYVSAQSIAAQPELAGRDEYLRIIGAAADLNRTLRPDIADLPTGAEVQAANDYGGETDWVDEVTRTGISHVHNLSYSGGANGTTYRASVNYRDIKGIGYRSDGFQQLNGRLSVTQKAVNDRLELSLDVTATDRTAEFFNGNIYKFATTYNPTAPVFANDAGFSVPQEIADKSNAVYGGYFQVDNFDYVNPVSIGDQFTNTQQRADFLYSARAAFDVTDDFTIQASYSRTRENTTGGTYASRTELSAGGANGNPAFAGSGNRFANDNRNELFEVTGTYNLDLGGNDLQLLAGYSWQEYNFQSFGAGGRGTPTDAFGFNNLSAFQNSTEAPLGINSSQFANRIIGFFGRARLSIGSAYNITASIRRDGTSQNGPENRWDIFPALSASADLVDALDLAGPDQLKFRIGYGITGSLPPGSYDYLATFAPAPGLFFPFGESYVATIGPTSNPNPNLRFEKKGEFNTGIDFAFMDYKLTGTLDFYIRNTGDLLFNAEVPTPPFLFRNVQANLNNVDLINTGVELSLGYNVEGSNFTWNPNLVFSTYNTRLEQTDEVADFNFGDGGSVDLTSTVPGAPGQNGFPVTTIAIGEEFGGLYTLITDDEATDASGEYVFLDAEGNAIEGRDPNNADRVLVGNGLPDFSIGFANSFTFGDSWDFSFFLRGDFGHDLVNMPQNFYGQFGNAVARPIDNIITTNLNENIISAPILNSNFVEDASFLALDNANLGYTFDLGGNSGFRNLRLYVAGQNLFYITGYSGVDPNVRYTDGGNALAPGIDRRTTFFRTRTVTFGASVGF